ncbi:hypothetical protein [Botrimarina mediterranea]|uniref:hypothetical protein n=1 Tax=Botrimarina mediterranea TaxID=2528022 RepID=UPI00118B7CB8|nr:hypothetical protein K2D_43240 [Planctomycetes bacterium K2D]
MDETAIENQPPGLIVRGYLTLDEIVAPILAEASQLCWWVNVQSGPFDPLWHYADKNEELVESFQIQTSTECTLWKTGFVSTLSPHVVVDEWSYFYGSAVDSVEFVRRAIESDKLFRSGSQMAEFLAYLCDNKDLFLIYVDGWWEIYDGNDSRRQRFKDYFSDASLTSWRYSEENE